MIHVYGTSHVSQESLEVIDSALEQHDPGIVALELDPLRLNALLTDRGSESGTAFLWLVKKFQDRVGSRTGLMPGEEMEYAFNRAVEEERDVALIDRDIRVTVERLKHVPRKEKVRAAFSILGGFLLPKGFDVAAIPGEEDVKQLLEEFRNRFPGLHTVLIEERNRIMAEALMQLQEDNPDTDIVAVVGAGHQEAVEQMISG